MKLCSQIKSENSEKYIKGPKTIMKIDKTYNGKSKQKSKRRRNWNPCDPQW